MHYGVRGMKWGVRHEPERSSTSSGRKKMSTAKKMAIGMAIAASVGGVSYYAIKTHRYNKAAYAAVQKVIKTGARVNRPDDFKALNLPGKAEITRQRTGRYAHSYTKQINKHKVYDYNKGDMVPAKLTGHSERLTKYGAARYETTRRKKLLDKASKYHWNDYQYYEDRYRSASEKMANIVSKNGGKVPAIRPAQPINKLKRQKGPKVLRVK